MDPRPDEHHLDPSPGGDEPRAAPPPSHVEDVAETSPHDERVAKLLEHTIDVSVLAGAVEQQEAADAADTLERLEEEEAADVLEQMEDRVAAQALAEMEAPLATGVLEDLTDEDPAYVARLLELMAPDDAADLLQTLDEPQRAQLLATREKEPADDLVGLLSYDRESAGGLMTTDFLALRDTMTLEEACEFIRSSPVPEETQYALVTDTDDHLVGIIGLRKLLLAQPRERVAQLMNSSVRAIRPELDREAVARTFDRYDYAMLPVADADGRLLGIVTVDDVIDIIRAEQTEDVQKTVGAGAGEAVYSGLGEKLRGRFPWLGASLIMTCLAAAVVLVFHEMIAEHTTLAYLLPVIAAVVGNAGHQALAVTLRGIVLDEVRRERVWPLVAREATVGLLSGAALGVVIFLFLNLPIFPDASWQLGLVAGISITIAMTVGTLTGAGVPLVMRGLGIDPAQSSAIVLIMITDAVAFTTLLGLSFVLLDHLPMS